MIYVMGQLEVGRLIIGRERIWKCIFQATCRIKRRTKQGESNDVNTRTVSYRDGSENAGSSTCQTKQFNIAMPMLQNTLTVCIMKNQNPAIKKLWLSCIQLIRIRLRRCAILHTRTSVLVSRTHIYHHWLFITKFNLFPKKNKIFFLTFSNTSQIPKTFH